jgi:signal transduction histidine kinase
MRLRSLRARLVAAGLFGGLLVVVIATLLIGEAFYAANERAFDRELRAELERLVGGVESEPGGLPRLQREPDGAGFGDVFSGRYWQVEHAGTRLRSRSLWDATLDIGAAPASGDGAFAHAVGPKAEPLRLLYRDLRLPHSARTTRFAVAGDRSALIADAAAFRWLVAATVAALALILLAMVWYQVRFALRPLSQLSQAVADVRAGRDARLQVESLPAEIMPLASHVNELLSHHERTVARARAATQDLAHALKTPLSVIAAACDRAAPDLATTVRAQVERIGDVLGHQLQGAQVADTRARAPLQDTVDALLQAMRSIHAARGIAFDAELAPGLVFAGNAEDLAEMIGNLLDNAGKWATKRALLRGLRDGEQLVLEVHDDGPGLPEDRLDDALARGVRLDQRVPGSGLGLAIVRQVTASYGGELRLANGERGLIATLRLPAA